MREDGRNIMKIGIVGLGSVGSTIAYSIAVSGIAEQLVLTSFLRELMLILEMFIPISSVSMGRDQSLYGVIHR